MCKSIEDRGGLIKTKVSDIESAIHDIITTLSTSRINSAEHSKL